MSGPLPPLIGAPWERPCGPHSPPGRNPITPYQCSELATVRSMRKAVMKRAWERVKEVEKRGGCVRLSELGDIISDEWKVAKALAERCVRGRLIAWMV